MASRKETLSRLYQGVSTQPGWRKFPGMMRDVLNWHLSVPHGPVRRSPTDHVANLEAGEPLAPILQPGEEYAWITAGSDVIAIGPDDLGDLAIFAFGPDGVPQTISDPAVIGLDYLGDDVATIRLVARGDTILVLNRAVQTALLDAPSGTVLGNKLDYYALPDTPIVGDIWKVLNDKNAFPHGHWKCTSASPVVWERIPEPDQAGALFDPATMPHLLQRDGAGGWDWGEIDWTPRLTGDALTNPPPKWAGTTIEAVAFHLGRLWPCGAGSIWSSRARDEGNLWTDNVFAINEGDPVKLDDTFNGGALLRMASCETSLYLEYERRQVEVTSFDLTLTNSNAKARAVAAFESADVQPVVIGGEAGEGSYLYALGRAGLHRFLTPSPATGLRRVDSPSEHAYIGWLDAYTIRAMIEAHGTLWLLTETDLVTYQLRIVNEQVVQSAWSRHSLPSTVRHLQQYLDGLRLWVEYDDATTARFQVLNLIPERRPVAGVPGQDSAGVLTYEPRLDHRELLTGVYDSETESTTFTLATPGDLATTRLVLLGAQLAREIEPSDVGADTATFPGRWDRPSSIHIADGEAIDFAIGFPILDTVEVLVEINGAPLNPAEWTLTFPDDATARIVSAIDGSPLPDGTGVEFIRDRDDVHYVGRWFRSELRMGNLFSADGRRPMLQTLLTRHVDSTDYRVELAYPGMPLAVSRWFTDFFAAVDLDTESGKLTRTGEFLHALGGDLSLSEIALVSDSAGQAIVSELVLQVLFAGA